MLTDHKKMMKTDEGLIKFLSDPATYGSYNRFLKIIQTHASYVFLTSRYVYKLKKPVDFGFLDFTTLEKRKHFCEREVILNSRLSSSYIGVISVTMSGGSYAFDGDGIVADYVVKMKRIPEKYFMKHLLAGGKISRKEMNRIVACLYKFYSRQKPHKEITLHGRPQDIARILKQNRNLALRFIGNTISSSAFDTIHLFNNNFLRINKNYLQKRVRDGFIKNCHGDLHLEHIIIRPHEIEIFDCIEFNDNFRFIDYACDIAFLSMDLDYHGRCDLSEHFVGAMFEKMEDENAGHLVNFYKCYRAYVRGKVGSIRASDINISEQSREQSVESAKKYFRQSLRYALFGSRPVVIVVFGLIASGKSTVANRLCEELGCRVISSDITRKQLADVPLTEKATDSHYKGIYSKKMTSRTYNKMFSLAHNQLKTENIVILDASFSDRKYREAIKTKSQKWNSNIYFIETLASERTIRNRLIEREKQKSISDARIDLLKTFKDNFMPMEKDLKNIHFTIKTDGKDSEDSTIKSLFRQIIRRACVIK